VLPIAESSYQDNLPTHYVTAYHLSKVLFSLWLCFDVKGLEIEDVIKAGSLNFVKSGMHILTLYSV